MSFIDTSRLSLMSFKIRVRRLSFAMSVVAREVGEGVRFEVLGFRFDTGMYPFVFLSDIAIIVCPIECPLEFGEEYGILNFEL